MHTILAATDLSAHARHAAERAAALAAAHGAVLTLLHAPPRGALMEVRDWLGAETEQRLRQDAQTEVQALAAALRASHGIEVQVRVDGGEVLQAVEQAAAQSNAGLVVLGARGAGFLRRLVLGTTAERLLRRASRPLLIVRNLPRDAYRRVLVALDFSPWTGAVLQLAVEIAPGARRVLCHAFQVPFEEKLRFAGVADAVVGHYRETTRRRATEQLHAAARRAGLAPGDYDAVIVEGDASQRLVEQEQGLDIDLVVLGKHGRSGIEDLLLGSTTKHLLAEGSADVAVATLPA